MADNNHFDAAQGPVGPAQKGHFETAVASFRPSVETAAVSFRPSVGTVHHGQVLAATMLAR